MTELYNLQRKIKVDTKALRKFAASLSQVVEEGADATVDVAIVSDDRMRQLNSTFRGKDDTTDVLSFPFEADSFKGQRPDVASDSNRSFLGDVVISAEQAQRQAEENGLDLETEIKQLILHGLLHLCGYDHETDDGEMNTRELDLRAQLAINE